MLEVLRQDDLSVEDRRSRIKGIAYARFDFQTMGKLVLARNWRKMISGQRLWYFESRDASAWLMI